MISKEEYLKALEIVEAYHKQTGVQARMVAAQEKSKSAIHLADLDASVRLYNSLKSLFDKLNLIDFRDINKLSRHELLQHPFGKKNLDELQALMNHYGIKFRDE